MLYATDPQAGRELLEQAADAGAPGAMMSLGMLLMGTDPLAARAWLERAAAAGQPAAMNLLGLVPEE